MRFQSGRQSKVVDNSTLMDEPEKIAGIVESVWTKQNRSEGNPLVCDDISFGVEDGVIVMHFPDGRLKDTGYRRLNNGAKERIADLIWMWVMNIPI